VESKIICTICPELRPSDLFDALWFSVVNRMIMLSFLRDYKRLLFLSVATAVFCGHIVFQAMDRSAFKPYWRDESNSLVNACFTSYQKMFEVGAISQSSPNPIYFAFQKEVVASNRNFGPGLMVKYRAVSIGAAAMLAFIILWTIGWRLGVPWGLFGMLAVTQKEMFQRYAAEDRPYMLWISFFSLVLLLGANISSKYSKDRHRLLYWFYFVAMLGLVLVAAPGFMQVIASGLTVLIFWFFHDRKRNFTDRSSSFLLSAVIVSAGLGYHYARVSKGMLPPDVGHYDLKNRQDYEMILQVLRIFISFDKPHNAMFSFFVLLGLFFPVMAKFFPRIKKVIIFEINKVFLPDALRFSYALWIAIWAQLSVTVFIGVAVYVYHYHFVPRVFLQLIVLRGVAASLGLFVAVGITVNILNRFWPNIRIRPVTIVKGAVAVVLIVLSFGYLAALDKKLKDEKINFQQEYARVHAEKPCPVFNGKVHLLFDRSTPDIANQTSMNFVVEVGREIERCGKKSEEGNTYVLPKVTTDALKTDGDYWRYQFELNTSSIMPDSRLFGPIHLCGSVVTL